MKHYHNYEASLTNDSCPALIKIQYQKNICIYVQYSVIKHALSQQCYLTAGNVTTDMQGKYLI